MLVLSRKQNESIHIGDDVILKVVRVTGGRVRLAIDAPDHVRITRGELVKTTCVLPQEAVADVVLDLQQAT